jgi:hypothetical protein
MALKTSTLSDAFRHHLRGRKVRALAFTTYAFEPSFFEDEILSTFLDVASAPNDKLRLAMLDEALRADIPVAVYYDPGALVASTRSSRLPISRVPMRPARGCFHPKNVFALLEDEEVSRDAHRPQRHLLFATMSANATRGGWWENVEVAHLELLSEGVPHPLVADVRRLIDSVRRVAADEREPHDALVRARKFLADVPAVEKRVVADVLQSRLFIGGETVVDFLWRTLKSEGVALNLEVISPFFDKDDPAVLRALIDRFKPAETRVVLPRESNGDAGCTEAYFASVDSMPDVSWAHLPADLMTSGTSRKASARTVHAKVYRLFSPSRRIEYVFSGSPNLTSAAHSGSTNFECGVLVDCQPKRVPEGWTARDRKKPTTFSPPEDDTLTARQSPFVALSLRFDWVRKVADAKWDRPAASPPITLKFQSSTIALPVLPAREWASLAETDSKRIQEALMHTSFVEASSPDAEPITLLITEEGMEVKPSIVLDLTAAEILKYWALLTPEQRSAFLDPRFGAQDLPPAERMEIQRRLAAEAGSMFDTFAAIFHAFGALEEQLIGALDKGEHKTLRARLLADKYDSLPVLLRRVEEDLAREDDAIRAYVTAMCARQVVERVLALLEKEDPLRADVKALHTRIRSMEAIRDRIHAGSSEDHAAFFKWFDRWFLKRVDPREAA